MERDQAMRAQRHGTGVERPAGVTHEGLCAHVNGRGKSVLAIAAVIDIALNARSCPVAAKTLANRHHIPPRHLGSGAASAGAAGGASASVGRNEPRRGRLGGELLGEAWFSQGCRKDVIG
jgi:hypothetical protein